MAVTAGRQGRLVISLIHREPDTCPGREPKNRPRPPRPSSNASKGALGVRKR